MLRAVTASLLLALPALAAADPGATGDPRLTNLLYSALFFSSLIVAIQSPKLLRAWRRHRHVRKQIKQVHAQVRAIAKEPRGQ